MPGFVVSAGIRLLKSIVGIALCVSSHSREFPSSSNCVTEALTHATRGRRI